MLSQNKKDLNDLTAVRFSVSFSQLPAAKKHTKNGAAVLSLRSFLFPDNFCQHSNCKAATRGKTGRTSVFPEFYKIEHGGAAAECHQFDPTAAVLPVKNLL